MGWLLPLLAGTATGILSGFGIGGGTLLLIYLTAFAGVPQNLAQGVNLLYFLPAAATALPAHIKNGYIDGKTVWPAALAGLAGTALAAWLATGLDVELLRRCFGGFLLVVGLRELKRRLAAHLETRSRDEWCALLEGSDACVAPILSMDEAPEHPHNRARGTFIELDGVIQPAPAPRFSRSVPAQPRPPVVGASGEEVLTDWGFTPEAITGLRQAGAIQ